MSRTFDEQQFAAFTARRQSGKCGLASYPTLYYSVYSYYGHFIAFGQTYSKHTLGLPSDKHLYTQPCPFATGACGEYCEKIRCRFGQALHLAPCPQVIQQFLCNLKYTNTCSYKTPRDASRCSIASSADQQPKSSDPTR
jgi:hypothetical protein